MSLMSDTRLQVVCEAYAALVGDNRNYSSKQIGLNELLRVFNPEVHPRVKDGSMAPSAAKGMLLRQMQGCAEAHNGCVTFDEFVRFHDKVSDEAEDERTWEVDKTFSAIVYGMWRVGDKLFPTGILPTFTSGIPTGLLATQQMNLIWPDYSDDIDDEDDEHASGSPSAATLSPEMRAAVQPLAGMLNVVKPTFARDRIPEELRGYFAFQSEVTNRKVRYIPLNPSVTRALDFIWQYEENKWTGFDGIISSSVTVALLPEELRAYIVPHSVAVARNTSFLQTKAASNPMYRTSNYVIGLGVDEECKKVQLWKDKSYGGVAYGQIYHGKTGKFAKSIASTSSTRTATGMNM